MPIIASYQKEILARVSPIVEKLIREDNLFEDLDLDKTSQDLVQLIERNLSPEEFSAMSDRELTERIDSVMGGAVLSNLLADLTPEQKAEVNAALSRSKQ